MHKPIVFNRHLNEKWSAKNNEIMVNKLNNVKAKINIKCPESFFFYKNQFNRTSERNTKMQQYEIQKNNEALFHKLFNVVKECHTNEIKRKTPLFSFKKNCMTGVKKYEIIRVAQENQHMHKRLTERGSFYYVGKWEKDWEKNQYYKRNHCIFPSIDFSKTNENFGKRYGGLSSKRNHDRYLKTTGNVKKRMHSEEKEVPKVLFKKMGLIEKLGICMIEFSVEIQNFIIKIEPNKKEIGYMILFDSMDSVEKIQKNYVKYDEITHDLYYDDNEDLVKFNEEREKEITCRYEKYEKIKKNMQYEHANTVNNDEEEQCVRRERDDDEEMDRKIKEEEQQRRLLEEEIEAENRMRQRREQEEREQEEKERRRQEQEAERIKQEQEEERIRQEQEEERIRQEQEEERIRQEQEREDEKKKLEEEKQKQEIYRKQEEEYERQRQEEYERQRQEEDERQRQEEDERLRQEEDERQRQEEDERQRQEEDERQRQEEDERQRQEEDERQRQDNRENENQDYQLEKNEEEQMQYQEEEELNKREIIPMIGAIDNERNEAENENDDHNEQPKVLNEIIEESNIEVSKGQSGDSLS